MCDKAQAAPAAAAAATAAAAAASSMTRGLAFHPQRRSPPGTSHRIGLAGRVCALAACTLERGHSNLRLGAARQHAAKQVVGCVGGVGEVRGAQCCFM